MLKAGRLMFHQKPVTSLSQLPRNENQLLDSSFESSSSLQLSAPSSEKNDIQKQATKTTTTTTTYWDNPEAKKLFNLLLKD